MRVPVKELARNKWPAILAALGIDKAFLVNRHGPCPMCDGTDRFRFDDKGDGRWFCNQCGAGDGVELVKRALRMDFKEAARKIEEVAGTAQIKIRSGPDKDRVERTMRAIWSASSPLTVVPAAMNYWNARAGFVPDTTELRAVTRLELHDGAREPTYHPGMIARVRGIDGTSVNLHRTYLAHDGSKANVPEPRRVMPLGLPDGCAVRLFEPTDGVIGIAEGIETAVSVTKLFGVACWAALNAQNLPKWVPPPGLKVIVYGDNDKSFTGQSASFELARRLQRSNIEVSVQLPPKAGWDWNDVLLSKKAAELADA